MQVYCLSSHFSSALSDNDPEAKRAQRHDLTICSLRLLPYAIYILFTDYRQLTTSGPYFPPNLLDYGLAQRRCRFALKYQLF
jgi:hypothetical protein